MIAHRAAARFLVDLSHNNIADPKLARLDFTHMAENVRLDLLRVLDAEQRQACAALRDLAAVADLPARFGVERCAVEDDDAAIAGHERVGLDAVLVDRGDARFVEQRLITTEFRFRAFISECLARLELARGARALALRLHRLFEARIVDDDAALAADVGREIERKAEGVVEREGDLTRENELRVLRCGPALRGQPRELRLEDPHAVLDRLSEALLLGLEHLRHTRLVLAKLGIRVAHLPIEVLDQAIKERLLLPQLVTVPDRTANDPAEHVAASLVAGDHPVDDQ